MRITFSTLVTPTRESEIWRVGTWFWTSSSEMAMRPGYAGGPHWGQEVHPRVTSDRSNSCYKSRTSWRWGPGWAAGLSRKDWVVGHQGGCLADGGGLGRGDRGAPSTDRGGAGEGIPHLRADLLGVGGDGG